MLDFANLPAVSPDAAQFVPLRALLQRMRDRPDYAALPTSSVMVPATDLYPFLPPDANLHVVVVDVPPAIGQLAFDWLCSEPTPSHYEGTFQEPFSCLRFEALGGEVLCVDVEELEDALVHAAERSTRLLLCIALGDTLMLRLLDSVELGEPRFAAALYECFRDARELRANLYYSIRKGYREVEPVDLLQRYEGQVCVVAMALPAK